VTVAPPAAVVAGRLGILGGTFDPVHLGHLAIAEEAREELGLERVLFVPAGDPWQKANRAVTPGAHRLAMVELAIAGNPALAAGRLELDRPGPSYTVDTLAALAADARAAGRAPDLWFILSAEALDGLPTWREPERILALAGLAVVPRPGGPPDAAERFAARYPGARAVFLDGPNLAISGTQVRARVAAGRSIRYLVPPAVEAYLTRHALYRGPTAATPPPAAAPPEA